MIGYALVALLMVSLLRLMIAAVVLTVKVMVWLVRLTLVSSIAVVRLVRSPG